MKDDDLDPSNLPDPGVECAAVPETTITHLATLSERVGRLLALCEQLTQDNQALRDQQGALQAERDTLRDKYEHSRARIDTMIVRLKGLEQSS